MSMADHADLVAEFCSITDAAPDVAESFLAAHDWQLEGALNTFFVQDPTEGRPAALAAAAHAGAPAAAQAQAQDYVEILDDDDDAAAGAELAELALQRASALAARQQAQQAEDELMASAAAAASGGAGPARQPGSPGGVEAMDLADDDLAAVAAAVGQEPGMDVSSFHRRQQEELLAMYQRQAAARQQQPATAAAASQGPNTDPFEDLDAQEAGLAAIGVAAPRLGAAAAAAAAGGGPSHGLVDAAVGGAGVGGEPDVPLDLPEGINLEEARMLEAAMLGIPYAGRIPDFSAAPAPAAPLSPGTLEQHAIRREQDQAYEESLALDRAKQESIAAAAAEAEAAERAQREAEEAATAAAARAALELQQLLASKAARLPTEPAAGTPGSLQIVVRLPSGSRKGRRFLPSDLLQAVFDFVDVECAAAAEGDGQEGGCGMKPGYYRLVTQFPRKVFAEDSSSSIQGAGITTDTALFIEPL